MIEVINPAWLALFVDGGRHGYADIGVPPSSALDGYAFRMVNSLNGNPPDTPALEVTGSGFSFTAGLDVWCAVTGAKVVIHVDNDPVEPWATFPVPKGSTVTVKEVKEGFRYYVGFSGTPALERRMGSRTTNVECRFGGFTGRPLLRGDLILFEEVRAGGKSMTPAGAVPPVVPPHILRVVEGPEMGNFTGLSLERFFGDRREEGFTVSPRINRTGIRLDGAPLTFRKGAERSIVSEGILPGTIQVPGDGAPIITLYERTIGGYARVGVVARADRDRLAHLKPRDRVILKRIGVNEAEKLWAEGSRLYDGST